MWDPKFQIPTRKTKEKKQKGMVIFDIPPQLKNTKKEAKLEWQERERESRQNSKHQQ